MEEVEATESPGVLCHQAPTLQSTGAQRGRCCDKQIFSFVSRDSVPGTEQFQCELSL